MNGMKEGAGEDPFAEDDDPTESTTEQSAASPDDTPEPTTDTSPEPTTESTPATESTDDQIPWVLRRNSVKENRENIVQYFLRDDVAALEDDVLEDVADTLDMRAKDVYTLDVREAMCVVAARHSDEVAEVLRDWGYEYK